MKKVNKLIISLLLLSPLYTNVYAAPTEEGNLLLFQQQKITSILLLLSKRLIKKMEKSIYNTKKLKI